MNLCTVPWSEDDGVRELSLGLAGYLRAVAKAVGVPSEGTTCEVTDTATAYLALTRRWPARPGRDLMLVWTARTGWILSVETNPQEKPIVVSRLGGIDPVPAPEAVAQFVTDALTRRDSEFGRPSVIVEADRVRLVEGLTRYAIRA